MLDQAPSSPTPGQPVCPASRRRKVGVLSFSSHHFVKERTEPFAVGGSRLENDFLPVQRMLRFVPGTGLSLWTLNEQMPN